MINNIVPSPTTPIHDELERRVEVLEKRKPEDSSPTMTNTIKEEVQDTRSDPEGAKENGSNSERNT